MDQRNKACAEMGITMKKDYEKQIRELRAEISEKNDQDGSAWNMIAGKIILL